VVTAANIGVAPTTLAHTQHDNETITYTADFTISNTGGWPLNWSGVTGLAWITLAPTSGTVDPAGNTPINVIVNTTGRAPGLYETDVTITSNDPDAPVTVSPHLAITVELGGCAYHPGDINGDIAVNGIDVVYGVSYFKGGLFPPITCPMCPQEDPFYAAGDVNGSCVFNGIDITFFVGYLKGQQPALLYCPTCPPAGGLVPSVLRPGLKANVTDNGGNR
jgi:hypothetical protein